MVELARTSASSESPAVDAEALRRGATVGRYVVLGVLGGGGMGVVYAAYDPELDRKVALKLVYGEEEEGRDRLMREAQAMAQLAHPNVVGVHGVEHASDRDFLVMEYVAGTTLREWLQSRARSSRDILTVFVDAGRGLAAAHAVGVVHRDFKPDNVLIDESGRVRVTDFGLARRIAEAQTGAAEAGLASDAALFTTVTRTGTVVGTPAYMAPEQHTGGEIDGRTDQFAYCVALYEALYGRRPFSGRTLAELKAAVLAGRLETPPGNPAVSARVRRVVTTGLAVSSKARFGSMTELLAELASSNRRTRLWLLPAAIVATAVAGFAIARSAPVSSDLCTGAQTALAQVWNPKRAEQGEQAFAALGGPAADVWHRASALLDQYGAGWVAMHTDTCEATRVRGEQSEESLDLRMSCLDQRKKELGSLISILSEADAAVASRALTAVYSLTPVSVCADARALRDRGLLPEDPQLRARVTELRSSLSQAKALRDTGKYPEALEVVRAAMETHALALEHLPAAADARQLLGELHKKMGDFQSAETELTEAVWAGEAGGNGEAVFAAAASLVGVARRQDKWDRALHWSRHADAVLRHLGDDDVLRAELHIMIGNLYWAKDDLPRAEGEYRAALERYERSRAEHPDTAYGYHNLALVLALRGQLDDAADYHRRALYLRQRSLGPKHPEVAESLHSLANVHNRKGEYQAATEKYEQALALIEEVLGPDSPRIADFLNNLGSALAQQGEYDAAAEKFARAAEMTQSRLGPDHSDLGYAFTNLGDLELLRKRPQDALGHFQRAAEIWEKTLGEGHSLLAHPLTGIGQTRVELSQPLEAIAPLERALALREPAGAGTVDLARTRFVLARALWDSGRDRNRALKLASLAREALVAAGDAHDKERREVETWLANPARRRG